MLNDIRLCSMLSVTSYTISSFTHFDRSQARSHGLQLVCHSIEPHLPATIIESLPIFMKSMATLSALVLMRFLIPVLRRGRTSTVIDKDTKNFERIRTV